MSINNQIPIGSKVIDPSGAMTNEWWRFFYNFATNAGNVTNITLDNDGLNIKDRSGSFVLTVEPGSTFTADRILTITTGDADRTFTLSGDLDVTADSTLSGDNTGDQNLFASIPVAGQTTVTASTTTQALTLVAGTHITITTNNVTKAITFTTTGLAGSGANSDITSMSGLTGDVGKPTSVTLATGGAIRTNTVAGNTALLQAYDVDGASYTTFATLTANNTPTFDLSSSTTLGGSSIVVGGSNSTITALTGLTGAISKPTSITMATSGSYRSDTGAGNTALLQAYNTGGSSYTTFATLTSGASPTFDLSSSTTVAGSSIVVSGSNSTITALTGLTGVISKPTSITMATTGGFRTDTTSTNTALLQAYNTGSSSYTTFGTLTAGATPTFNLAATVTVNSNRILNLSGSSVVGNFPVFTDTVGTVQDSSSAAITSATFITLNVGNSGNAGTLNIFPATASSGNLKIIAANNSAGIITTITQAAATVSRTYTIPNCGSAANFIMGNCSSPNQTITTALTINGSDLAVSCTNCTLNSTNNQIGQAGAGTNNGILDFYPTGSAIGRLRITPAAITSNTILTITNADQAAARTYTIPDAGGSCNFSMRFSESVTVSTSALKTSAAVSRLNIASAGSVTLAAPAAADIGIIKLITMQTSAGNITLALTNVIGQSSGTTATFANVNDALVVMATDAKWLVLKEYGITLS